MRGTLRGESARQKLVILYLLCARNLYLFVMVMVMVMVMVWFGDEGEVRERWWDMG